MTTVANERLLFVHIPKTGGTWATEAMESAGVRFAPVSDDPHPEYPELPREGHFTMAFVREPLAWYRSLWSFHRRWPQEGWEVLDEFLDLDLPVFLRRVATEHPGWLAAYYDKFVGTPDEPIDFVGRQEHLRTDLIQALRMARQTFDEERIRTFPARNFSGEARLYGTLDPPPAETPVPDDVAELVRRSEREVYARFYESGRPATSVTLTCNICGTSCETFVVGRDKPSCPSCHSTGRTRAVIRVLSKELFGRDLALPDFPERPDLAGIGLSDWGYTSGLAAKLDYRNTFYDEEPRLDITDPPPELEGTLDFVISSDVFEHVPPPVDRAFEGAYRLLKPGGVLVLTVPYLRSGPTLEHFPELHDWRIEGDGPIRIVNRTRQGALQVIEEVPLHAGPGLTVEMRIFSHPDLLRQLRSAGFSEITDYRPAHGPDLDPAWWEAHSFPIAARR